MTLLAPTLLVLGVAVAVPLVLHLLHRHRAPRVVFPAVRYLRRVEREHGHRIRLRQRLVLALRVLGILLLATPLTLEAGTLPAGDSILHPDGSARPIQLGTSHPLTSAGFTGNIRAASPHEWADIIYHRPA